MRWRGERQSENVEDRRGVALLLGADPRQLLDQVTSEGPAPGAETSRPTNPQEEELKQFVSVVLANTEDVWTDIFRQSGRQYRKPSLVLFTDQVRSACGIAGAAVGPFYLRSSLRYCARNWSPCSTSARHHGPG